MISKNDDILKSYIRRVLELQSQGQTRLSARDLEQVARELGLSDEDITQLNETVRHHLERARHYIQNDIWSDAILELEQAQELSPLDEEITLELARAHVGRWQEKQMVTDRNKARRLLKQLIKDNPHHRESYQLLRSLKTSVSSTSRATGRTRIFILAGVAALVFISVIVFIIILPIEPESTISSTDGVSEASVQHIPVSYLPGPHTDLTFDPAESKLNRYNHSDEFSYTLNGDLISSTDEIHELELQMQCVDAAGNPIFIETDHPISSATPYARPGESIPIYFIILKKDTHYMPIASVTLRIVSIQREPASDSYPLYPPLPIQWQHQAKPQFNFSIRIRSNDMRNGTTNRFNYVTLLLENHGNKTIKRMKAQLEWTDPMGAILDSNRRFLISPSDPPLRAHYKRPIRFIGTFPADYAAECTYRFTVEELE
jgi:tetratricopeptide (TPR) repeat protein